MPRKIGWFLKECQPKRGDRDEESVVHNGFLWASYLTDHDSSGHSPLSKNQRDVGVPIGRDPLTVCPKLLLPRFAVPLLLSRGGLHSPVRPQTATDVLCPPPGEPGITGSSAHRIIGSSDHRSGDLSPSSIARFTVIPPRRSRPLDGNPRTAPSSAVRPFRTADCKHL